MLASRKAQIIAFFVLAFVISWTLWTPAALLGGSEPSSLTLVLVLVGSFSPTLAAVLLTAVHEGEPGLKRLLDRLFAWRVGARWYLVVLVGTAIVGLLTMILHSLVRGPALTFSPVVPWFVLPFAFLIGLLFGGPLNEEVGWRGYALPRFQADWGALFSSLVLGVLWGLWHLPVFFVAEASQSEMPFLPFMLWVIALSILFTWVYNGTGGSLLLAVLAHGATNFVAGSLFPIFPPRSDGTAPFLLYAVLFVVAAVAVVLLTGPERLSRKAPHPKVSAT